MSKTEQAVFKNATHDGLRALQRSVEAGARRVRLHGRWFIRTERVMPSSKLPIYVPEEGR